MLIILTLADILSTGIPNAGVAKLPENGIQGQENNNGMCTVRHTFKRGINYLIQNNN